MDESNPVVILNDNSWHMVEDSRRSAYSRCGKPLRNRRAHTRLRTIGEANLCRACLRLYKEENEFK